MRLLDSQPNYPHRYTTPIAALLLDVENFCLKVDLEEYLRPYCNFPIKIKLAVAHWQNQSIASLDLFLHKQRYQLIHVPKEKNAADAQILTLGTSLLLHYPQITEIIVVSQDSILDYLHHNLISLGCNTYKVYQQANKIYIHDILNNRTNKISVKTDKKAQNNDSREKTSPQDIKSKIISHIDAILKNAKNQSDELPLNIMCQEYKKKYQKNLSEILKETKLGKSPIKFLKNNCSDKFQIKQKKNIYYLSLK